MQLKWYEWLGWAVAVILISFGLLCFYTFFQEREWRAFFVVVPFFTIICGGWLWVLLKYSK
jgi:hypothetical protein